MDSGLRGQKRKAAEASRQAPQEAPVSVEMVMQKIARPCPSCHRWMRRVALLRKAQKRRSPQHTSPTARSLLTDLDSTPVPDIEDLNHRRSDRQSCLFYRSPGVRIQTL